MLPCHFPLLFDSLSCFCDTVKTVVTRLNCQIFVRMICSFFSHSQNFLTRLASDAVVSCTMVSCTDLFSAIYNPSRHGNEFASTVRFFLATHLSEDSSLFRSKFVTFEVLNQRIQFFEFLTLLVLGPVR